jgi:DNA polymerase III psi subunit
MLAALLRAAGRDRASADAAALVRRFPPASALRGDAAAKRALWPELRRLRRQR